MNSKVDAPKGVSKALRVFLLLLVVLYFAFAIAYLATSATIVAGIGIIPITISGVLSLSELGVLDRLLPKLHHEYNIVLGDNIAQKTGYKLRTSWRLLLDIALVISLLLVDIFLVLEFTTAPYHYFDVTDAFLASYCSMPLGLGIISHSALAAITITDMFKKPDQLCAQCAGRIAQGHEGGSAAGGPEASSGAMA